MFKRLILTLSLLVALWVPAFAAQNPVQTSTTSALPGLTLVTNLNNAALNYITLNSGGSAPTVGGLFVTGGATTTAGVVWHDTSTNGVKVRNLADTAWVRFLDIDETNNVATPDIPVVAGSSGLSVASTEHYGEFVATAAQSFTLAQTNTLWNGFAFSVFAEAGNATVSINGADSVNGGTAGAGVTIPKGYVGEFRTDGAGNWYLHIQASVLGTGTIASASTTDLCSIANPYISISGTTTISSFGASCQAGQSKIVKFSGALTLTYNASSLILPSNAANIATAVGDTATIVALGSSNFIVTSYQPASGAPVSGGGAPPTLATSVSLSATSATAVAVSTGPVSMWNGANQATTAASMSTTLNSSGASSCTVGAVDCLDTGSLANSTWYYVWAISNGSAVHSLLSASSTSPTMPAGYNFKTLIGVERTNGSGGLVALKQLGQDFQWVVGGTNVTALPILISGTSGNTNTPTWTAVAIAACVPPIASRVRGTLFVVGASIAILASNGSYGAHASTTNPPLVDGNFNSGTEGDVPFDIGLEGSNIYYAGTASNDGVACLGGRLNL